eukprot:GHVU01050683.1.p2 GENE.GHVU01050683.1~~GHVU01050683.1.p2  ORF type:complete len:100 (-),score=25.90 GHVU01050683.1:23-322(-)
MAHLKEDKARQRISRAIAKAYEEDVPILVVSSNGKLAAYGIYRVLIEYGVNKEDSMELMMEKCPPFAPKGETLSLQSRRFASKQSTVSEQPDDDDEYED